MVESPFLCAIRYQSVKYEFLFLHLAFIQIIIVIAVWNVLSSVPIVSLELKNTLFAICRGWVNIFTPLLLIFFACHSELQSASYSELQRNDINFNQDYLGKTSIAFASDKKTFRFLRLRLFESFKTRFPEY